MRSHLSFGALDVGRVQEDSSVHQRPVDVRHHGADIAGVVGLAAVLQFEKGRRVNILAALHKGSVTVALL